MKRIIGIPSQKAINGERPPPQPKPVKTAPPNLSTMISKIDTKAENFDKKIEQCETELKKLAARMKTMQEGSTKNTLKSKAYGILQRKKMFEQQAETMRQQSFNFEQASGALDSAKDAVTTVQAMKSGVKELKKTQKKIPIDSVENLHDELNELMEISDDIQNVFVENLNVPEMDDKELENELELLGDEFVADPDTSYLDAANGAVGISAQNQAADKLLLETEKNLIDMSRPTDPDNNLSCMAPDIKIDFTQPLFNPSFGPLAPKEDRRLF